MGRVSVVLASLAIAAPAVADPITLVPGQGSSIDESMLPVVAIERPRTAMVWQPPGLATPTPAVNSNVIFLNRCASGCLVRFGQSDSINDTWQLNVGSGTLQPFQYGDTAWGQVVACVRDVFSPFNVQITDVDPGTAAHFEIMIAGRPADLGFGSGIGGIAPFDCSQSYIPNALVFDFANVWQGNVDEICATAAQEIAHAWTMDHVTEPSDPMTYNPYSGVRYFKDGVLCGSDCINPSTQQLDPNGVAPLTGAQCTNNVHVCSCHQSTTTQNDVSIITTLFGAGTLTPPTVTIDSPTSGAVVQPGFAVHASVSDADGVGKAELRVDGTLAQTLTAAPFAFTAPTTLAGGAHHVEVEGYDTHGAHATAAIDVMVVPCTQPSDCPKATDTCVGGRCVPGPGTTGGLGQPCTANTDCASGMCASDGTQQVCVESCVPGMNQCPSGFGCAMTGASQGVCFPGFDDGSGGLCSTTTGGPISLGLVLAAFVFIRRRRR